MSVAIQFTVLSWIAARLRRSQWRKW